MHWFTGVRANIPENMSNFNVFAHKFAGCLLNYHEGVRTQATAWIPFVWMLVAMINCHRIMQFSQFLSCSSLSSFLNRSMKRRYFLWLCVTDCYYILQTSPKNAKNPASGMPDDAFLPNFWTNLKGKKYLEIRDNENFLHWFKEDQPPFSALLS